jgi:hypothetical protein
MGNSLTRIAVTAALLLLLFFVVRPFWSQHKKAKAASEMAWMMSWLEPKDLYLRYSTNSSISHLLHGRDQRLTFRNGQLIDPWGSPYRFKVASQTNFFDVTISSAGRDRQFGTSDDLSKPFTIR